MNDVMRPKKDLRNLQYYRRPGLQDRVHFESEAVIIAIGAVTLFRCKRPSMKG